eukprot:gene3490-biopygen10845
MHFTVMRSCFFAGAARCLGAAKAATVAHSTEGRARAHKDAAPQQRVQIGNYVTGSRPVDERARCPLLCPGQAQWTAMVRRPHSARRDASVVDEEHYRHGVNCATEHGKLHRRGPSKHSICPRPIPPLVEKCIQLRVPPLRPPAAGKGEGGERGIPLDRGRGAC